jgi:hypothetical protein
MSAWYRRIRKRQEENSPRSERAESSRATIGSRGTFSRSKREYKFGPLE